MQSMVMQRLSAVMALLLLVGAGGLFAAEQPEPPTTATPATDDLELLVSWMSGSFSSKAHSEQDKQYFDIRVRMAPVWTERDDGHWLYIEQAVAQHQDQPYRQRIYRVVRIADNLFESSVYLLPDAESAVAVWQQESPLADLSPDQLSERTGCSILMRRRGETFHGSTLGSLCESSLRGASYATSVVTIAADQLVSWDRGFDADGAQVWGAEKAGYRFTKLGGLDADEPFAPPQQESSEEADREADSEADREADGEADGEADSEADSEADGEADSEVTGEGAEV